MISTKLLINKQCNENQIAYYTNELKYAEEQLKWYKKQLAFDKKNKIDCSFSKKGYDNNKRRVDFCKQQLDELLTINRYIKKFVFSNIKDMYYDYKKGINV